MTQFKLGIYLLAAQLVMLAFTYGFYAGIDERAAQDGVAAIIQEASR